MEKVDKREGFIDLFRGIGIILMVIGHMKFQYKPNGTGIAVFNEYSHYIHAFHMPMFFFLSGFCYQKSKGTIVDVVKKRARRLLIPYFFFGISEFFLWRIFIGDSISPLLHLFWINTEGLAIAGALWFLTALFVTSVIYSAIDMYINNRHIITIICIVLAGIGCILPGITDCRLPYAIDSAMVGVGFFHLGRLIRPCFYVDKKPFFFGIKWWVVIPILVINVIMIMYNGGVNMRVGRYSNIVLFWINAVLAILIGLYYCKEIDQLGMNNCKILCLINEKIKTCGQNGIVYVCTNELIITVYARILQRLVKMELLYNICILILTFLTLRLMTIIIASSKIRIFIGRDS